MSYLLFMDESGHDHKSVPYEVRGGICVHSSKVADLIKDIEISEKEIFGCRLAEFKTEIKGSKLLKKERFKWAVQESQLSDEERKKGCRRFLTAHLEGIQPLRRDFTAYGQASLKMAHTIFKLLLKHKVQIVASVIKKGIEKPKNFQYESFLRKDHCFLMERFYLLLERANDDGLVIMDQVEKGFDIKFARRLKKFFYSSSFGKKLSKRIIPEPLFIESGINYLIQIADLCIYVINVAYRKNSFLTEPCRSDVRDQFETYIQKLEFNTYQYKIRDGRRKRHHIYGISFTEKPYIERKNSKEKEAMQ